MLPTATILQANYEKNYSQLKKIGRLYQVSDIEVEDIINQTFLDFVEKKIDFSTINNPDGYIVTCFKRKLIDFYRRKRSSKISGVIDCTNIDVEDRLPVSAEEKEMEIQTIEKLYELFKKIPRRCQKAIFLKYYRHLSNEEIARQTGHSVQTIYNNLSEGIKKLRLGFGRKAKVIYFPQELSRNAGIQKDDRTAGERRKES